MTDASDFEDSYYKVKGDVRNVYKQDSEDSCSKSDIPDSSDLGTSEYVDLA
jgi:hypothetical protein